MNEMAQVGLVALYEHFGGDLYAALDDPPFPKECPGGGMHDFAFPVEGRSVCRGCPANVTLTVGPPGT